MAEKIVEGYLVHKQNFGIFDEIITFISKSGRKYTCLSKGSKKIISKNARNLFLGSYCEFIIFEARFKEKVSKLKKVTAIEPLDYKYEGNGAFQLLNELVLKSDTTTQDFFVFYRIHLNMILNYKRSQDEIMLITLKDFINMSGINFQVNECALCGSNAMKTISLKNHGLICNACAQKTNETFFNKSAVDLFIALFNDVEIKKYSKDYDLAIELLKQYIYDNLGIKIISSY